MRIGELSQRTGVSLRSLRYYETVGLLCSERSSSGQRHFADAAVDRVALVQELFAAGLCSSKIARLLPRLEGDPEAGGPTLREELLVQEQRLDAGMEDLRRAHEVLARVMARSGAVPESD